MALYDQFAPIYQRGPYVRFSLGLVDTILPDYFDEIGITPAKILDIACGEGSFAVAMAQSGYRMTGIDLSPQMIELAMASALEAQQEIRFLVEDMRSIPFKKEFDLATCFFDSLNYMLTVADLQDVFKGAFRALKRGGGFIFDMNTIYGLAVDWMREETYVQNEKEDFIEIHRQSFDYENLIATMDLTVFQKQEGLWRRIDETHRERGYPVADIQFLLLEAGFEIMGMFGNLGKRSELQMTSPRVWFSARKP
jgi:SAM-dependent methyltransferase